MRTNTKLTLFFGVLLVIITCASPHSAVGDIDDVLDPALKAESERLLEQGNQLLRNYQDGLIDTETATAEFQRIQDQQLQIEQRQSEINARQKVPSPQPQPKQQSPQPVYEAPPEPEPARPLLDQSLSSLLQEQEQPSPQIYSIEQQVSPESSGGGRSSASLMDQITSDSPELEHQQSPPSAQIYSIEQQVSPESSVASQSSASLMDQITSDSPEQEQPQAQPSAQTSSSGQQVTQEYAASGQSSESLMDQITSNSPEQEQPQEQPSAQTSSSVGNYVRDVAVETVQSLGNETLSRMKSGEDSNPEAVARSVFDKKLDEVTELPNFAAKEVLRQYIEKLPPEERRNAEDYQLGNDFIKNWRPMQPSESKGVLDRSLDLIKGRVNEVLGNSNDLSLVYEPNEPLSSKIKKLLNGPLDYIERGMSEITIKQDESE